MDGVKKAHPETENPQELDDKVSQVIKTKSNKQAFQKPEGIDYFSQALGNNASNFPRPYISRNVFHYSASGSSDDSLESETDNSTSIKENKEDLDELFAFMDSDPHNTSDDFTYLLAQKWAKYRNISF